MAKKKNKYYAYSMSGEEGIVTSWPECERIVKGQSARYKGFPTEEEARKWLNGGAVYESKEKAKAKRQIELPEDAIYFDAGTGRGVGTEARVSDRNGTSLTWMAVRPEEVTKEGNLLLNDKTNNYGELMGCYMALQIALKLGRKIVMGDSKLVIDFWSLGKIRKETSAENPDLVALVRKVQRLRKLFEKEEGKIIRISGDDNPADLGFHK